MYKIFQRKSKKAQAFDQMSKLAVGVASLAIVLTVAFLVMAEGKDQIVDIQSINESNPAEHTLAYNSTNTLQEAVDIVPTFVPIVIIAAIGAVLLGLVALFRRR